MKGKVNYINSAPVTSQSPAYPLTPLCNLIIANLSDLNQWQGQYC